MTYDDTPSADEIRQTRRTLAELAGGERLCGRDELAEAIARAHLRRADQDPDRSAFHVRRANAYRAAVKEEQ